MRILLVHKFWRSFGGVEEHVRTIAEDFQRMGHEVVPFAMQDDDNWPSHYASYFPKKVEFRQGVNATNVVPTASRAIFGTGARGPLRRLLRDVDIDVAHVVSPYHQLGSTLIRTIRAHGIPVILSLHDYKPGCPNYSFFSDSTNKSCTLCLENRWGWLYGPAATKCWNNSRSGGALLTLEATAARAARIYSRNVDAYIVLNDLQRNMLGTLGVEPSKVFKVPHRVSVPEVPTRILRQPDGPALFVGRLVAEKGVDTLLRACAEADMRVWIAGDGPERSRLANLNDQLGRPAEFFGTCARSRVKELMASASMMIVPSTGHDVSPLVVVESFVAGLPVIGTRVGGIPDQLDHGRGLIVTPDDPRELAGAMRRWGRDPQERANAAHRAFEWISSGFGQEDWERRMSEVYSSVGVELQ